jgi:maltose alpha-D-glucosyltransferase/alpha-amylase
MDWTILDDWRQDVQWHTSDAVLLCEANVDAEDIPKYCTAIVGGPNDRAQMMFSFGLNAVLWLALARGEAEPLVEALNSMPKLPAMAQWATFLRNHDELDLSRLTEEQRSDVMRAFAPKPEMRIYNRGIRRRLAPMLRGDRRHMELAYSLQFTMPGTPVLRYGEEIGMGEDLSLTGRDAIRTPMQWEATTRGFSTAEARDLVRPMPARGRFSNRNVNVAEQRTDPLSLLRWFGRLINEVRECPEISVGTLTVLDLPLPRSVIVHRYDAPEGSILLLHNLADRAVTVDLSAVEVTKEAYTVFCDGDYGPLPRSLKSMHLNGWGYHWIRLRRGS